MRKEPNKPVATLLSRVANVNEKNTIRSVITSMELVAEMLKWLAHTWNQRTRRTFYQLLSGTGFALCLSAMKPRFHVVKDVRRTVDKACTVAQEDASEVIGLEKFLNMLDMSELAISVLKNECEKFESRSMGQVGSLKCVLSGDVVPCVIERPQGYVNIPMTTAQYCERIIPTNSRRKLKKMCGTACTNNAEEPAKRSGITEEQPYENYIHRHDFWKSGRSNSTASYCKHQKNPGATCAVKKSTAKWMEYEYNRLYLNGENSGSKSRRTRRHGRRQEPNDRRAVGLDNRADCVTITAWDVPSQGRNLHNRRAICYAASAEYDMCFRVGAWFLTLYQYGVNPGSKSRRTRRHCRRQEPNRRPYCGKQQQVVLHALYYQGCLLKAAEKGNSARSTESSAKTLQPLASVQNTVCPVLTIPGVLPRSIMFSF
ncbi:hypothetical protein T4E_11254 [Trichinella pseudospiralis]|uniref:Uncharacterized protein n=1 Tax=Trichinella pseudospiralis TaxID=6337 RepID=A0A0V0XXA8_TRIPS|nr:hypothetical protein T4E_11254 [Trichinella pseudospiralis]